MRSRPREVSEVELAALLGHCCTMQRQITAIHELAESGGMRRPPRLDVSRRQVAATIETLLRELHQLGRDPAQLSLFHEPSHATH